jgi:hypothetical protein
VSVLTTTTGRCTQFDWLVEQDELIRLRIPVLDEAGALFDVTGWTVDAKIKTARGGSILHTWTSGDIDATGAYVTLTILPATSLAWPFRRGFFRVKVTNPGDATQRYRILEGNFTLSVD